MITLVLKMSDVRSKGSELCKISYALYCTLNYKLFWAYVIQVKVSLRKQVFQYSLNCQVQVSDEWMRVELFQLNL